MPVTPLRPADPGAVGPYRLLGRLGQGGTGTVYLGVAPDERAVAVKVLREEIRDRGARRRFARELDALRRVSGPHLVDVLDGDADGEPPYLVTRFVPGQRLDEVVARSGPLDPDALHRLARGVADALATLHAAGLVHRDLTPGNVLLLDGQPHVIDLGLAVAADVTALTASGLVVGTPGYLAPEQVLGAAPTPAVDVHAWGATIALAATGRPPYGTGRADAVLYRIVHGQPDLDAVPEPLATLVRAAMHSEPEGRPTAAALLARLGGPSTAAPVTVRLPHDVAPEDIAGLQPTADPDATQVVPADLVRQLRALADEPATDRLLVGTPSGPQPLPPAPTRRLGPFPLPPAGEGGPDGPPTDRYDGGGHDRYDDVDDRYDDEDEFDGGDDRDDRLDLDLDRAPAPDETTSPTRRAQALVTGASALLVLAALTLVAPVLGALVALTLLAVLRTLVRSSQRLRTRRERRGERRRDALLVVVGSPWHLLRGVLDAVLAVPFVAVLTALPAGAVWLADPFVDGLERVELTAATAVVVGTATALGLPAQSRSRRMLRRALVAGTPGTASALTVLAVLAGVALLLLSVAEGSSPSLWPLAV
ncbi:MAG: serine/threonine protein kinase [Actinomycetota bacterium]|nr:serine/threonine protein kinase [Actinomycetota bacterium]